MADISTYLQAIQEAVYGEEVRGAIHDALQAMNDDNNGVVAEVEAAVNDDIKAFIESYLDEHIDQAAIEAQIRLGIQGLPDDSIPGVKMENNSISGAKMENDSISGVKIESGAVSEKLFGSDYQTLEKLFVPGKQYVLYLGGPNTDYYTIEHIKKDVSSFPEGYLINNEQWSLKSLIERECNRINDPNIRIADIKIINQYVETSYTLPGISYYPKYIQPLPNYDATTVAGFQALLYFNNDDTPYDINNQARLICHFSKGDKIIGPQSGTVYVHLIMVVNYKHMGS